MNTPLPPMKYASVLVIRCFKKVEHFADWITGAAGPVFVFLCWVLIGSGGLLFFDVVARDLSYLGVFLLSPILSLVPLNMYGQYYLVTHVPPGYPAPKASGKEDKDIKWTIAMPWSYWSGERWGFIKGERPLTGGYEGSDGAAAGGEANSRVRRCRKCDGPKPERTHHCSVCKRCVLMMDHHCPWINGCVGLYNQRHFVLFMAWLSIGCWTVCGLGYRHFINTFSYRSEWKAYTPKIGFTLIYVLCIAIGVAVPVLMSWHLYMVSKGETSIESHDNAYLEKKAQQEGLIYLNPYDLGRRRNLELFFNVGPGGYSMYTLLFPLVIPPSSNGWTFTRRPLPTTPAKPPGSLHAPELAEGLGLLNATTHGGHAEDGLSGYVMGDDGSLTDDDEGGGGWMD
ncbi:hypothetical protein CI109_104470 [Kwoniella shandongensis]|uniref:Palmitoyltransferase n=1 Tax=Kwoniella shandongensis TaxID=1734106 RepID=A0AAJ8LLB5_9TREE